MIKALLFDLDGTLFDHEAASAAAFRGFWLSHRPGSPWREAKGKWDAVSEHHFRRYVRGEISHQEQRRMRVRDMLDDAELGDADADALFAVYLAGYERNYALFPDVLPFLARTRGLPLGLISNGQTSQQKDKLARLGIQGRFGAVLISEEAGLRKPDPGIFRLAAESLRVRPEECLFIGDDPEADYAGALGAGMESVLLDRTGRIRDPGIRRIAGLPDLSAILDAHQRDGDHG